MLSSIGEDEESESIEEKRRRFYHIASPSDRRSVFYHRDLPFLMDTSIKISQFGLALELGENREEISILCHYTAHSIVSYTLVSR